MHNVQLTRRLGRFVLVCAALFAALFLCVGRAAAAENELPPGFQDTELEKEGFIPGHALEEPTVIRFAKDGRVFIAQKEGEILVYENIADKTPTVFADLRTQVYDKGDRGILGLELDPKFTEGRPYVYVLYTYDHILGEPGGAPRWGIRNHGGDDCPEPHGADDCLVSGRLVRLTAEGNHAATEIEHYEEGGGEKQEVVPAEKVLVEGWCQQFSSHSIGDLHFGPEGDLYASGGDGASFESADFGQLGTPPNPCGDPPNPAGTKDEPPSAMGGSLRSQNEELLNGKVIRVDPDTGKGVPGNPLYESSSNENVKRIVGEGFRNPYRFTIDPKTDELFVGNVGWGTFEEIDRFPVPDEDGSAQLYNSGWPCYEGDEKNPGFAFLGLTACEELFATPGSTSPPFFVYEHGEPVTPEDPCATEYGSAISGFKFYEGENFPSQYKGALFFSDPVRQCIYAMFPGENGELDPSTTIPFLTNGGLYPGIDIEEGPEGDLYYVKLFGSGFSEGSIHRISYNSGNQPPIARLKVVGNNWGPENEEFEFNAFESDDADTEDVHQLVYSWDLNGDGKFEDWPDEGTAHAVFNDDENHIVSVKVTDPHGAYSVARVEVFPGDNPPEPEILEPSESLQWAVGDVIHFKGLAHDADEPGGLVPEENLVWDSRLYHCPFGGCHTHPIGKFPGQSAGEFIAPAHGYPTQIELKLTATDARGLTTSRTVHLFPKTVNFDLESNPSGIELSAGELTRNAPFELTTILNSEISLSAPKTVTIGGVTYAWQSWSDGGARVHTVLARCSATYTASYAVGTTPNEAPTTQTDAPCGQGGGGGGGGGGEKPREEPGPGSKPPGTKLKKHPPKHTKSTTAKFVFAATEKGSKFRCKLDKGRYKPCRSPKVYRHLHKGKHAFSVYAVGPDGKADKSPSKFVWHIG
jgi:glucose/arabinose dehydrogenase